VDDQVTGVQTCALPISHDRVAALPGLLGCRTLIVAGEADRIIPVQHSEVIAAELPAARLLRLPGVGHMALLEQPDVVNQALVELVTEVARPAGLLRWLRKRA
jgi:pimeloyl-ACP methyl ester carboxylesterase